MTTDATAIDPAELQHELERLRAELDADRRRIRDELAFARRVQLNLMPRTPPLVRGWEIATSYRPAREVGGDFFDVYPLPQEHDVLGFVVADVTGKGVTAALMMAFTRAVLRSAAYNGSSPADALRRTNRVLVREARTGLFLTAFMGWLDTRSGRLRWASAGHDPPVLVRASRTRTIDLDGAGELLGMFDDLHVRTRTVTVEPGDVLVVQTDGVTDARNERDEFFGDDRFVEIVRANAVGGAASVVDALEAELEAFQGAVPAADDVTLLAIARAGTERSA